MKIYRSIHRGQPNYTLAYTTAEGRQRMSFKGDLARAKQEGSARAEQLAKGDAEALRLTGHDRAVFIAARTALDPLGIALDAAARDFAQAVAILGGKNFVIEACRHYVKTVVHGLPDMTVRDAVARFTEAKRREELSELYLKDLDSYLGRFSAAFQCQLRDVTADLIRAYVDAMPVGTTTRNNHLRVIRGLFTHAKAHAWIDQTRSTPADAIKLGKAKTGPNEVLTPEEMRQMLAHAPARFLPHVILNGFCGVRKDEITEERPKAKAGQKLEKGKRVKREPKGQLRWEDIDFRRGVIIVPAEISKTKKRRKIELQPNARAWLEPYANLTGFVYALDERRDRKKLVASINKERRKHDQPPFKWKKNGLRNSFCSYALELTKNATQVEHWAGNSAKVIMQNYFEIVHKEDCDAYWAITPKNVKRRSKQ